MSVTARPYSTERHVPAGSGLFVVSTHKVRERTGKPPHAWVPYGAEHAWRPGSRRTLCGEWTADWIVFWERPFTAQAPHACRACVEASLPAASRSRLAPRHEPERDLRSA